jgi:hypothetical protein
MAGIFDDLRDKGNGILSSLNDFLYNSKSTLPTDTTTDPETSGLNYQRGLPLDPTDKTAGQYGGIFDKRQEFYPAGESTPNVTINNKPYVNPNAKTPKPKDPAENTFLGAVGEYFNNAQKTWKDKGGFDALMSNPQFGVGLSLLQQASEGKTIGSSALKAMVDGGVISDAYAKKIAARAKVIGPATAAQIEQVKARLLASGYGSTPSIYRQIVSAIKGGNATAEQEMAFAEIAQKANKLAEDAAKSGRGQGVEFQVYQDKAIVDYIKENGLDKGGLNPFNRGSVKGSDKLAEDISKLPKRELGGPVAQGKAYLVGEAGPEVFIAKQTGKIVSTDDSKIINLLLESNPQLKNVSPARAEKILRNRFPDYFE